MKRKLSLLALCIVALSAVLVFAMPQTAKADMGPKQSINITFINQGDEECYVTMLSQYESTGPYSTYDPEHGLDYKNLEMYDSNYYDNPDYHNEELERIWKAFADYQDVDGYYFLQLWWKLYSDNNRAIWDYYPPHSFKLLLYYPERDVYLTSGIYERYAFDSYYTVDLSVANEVLLNPDANTDSVINLEKSYDYTWEIISLLCRIVLTIAVEMVVALMFLIKGRKPLLTILFTNLATQIALNVALNLMCYFSGELLLLFLYIPLEIGVTLVEGVTYSLALRKQGVPVWKSILYAQVANIVSAVLGFVLALVVPGIF